MKTCEPLGFETDELKMYTASTLLATSAALGWSTISAELRSHGAKERQVATRKYVEVCLAVVGNKNARVKRISAGQSHDAVALTGTAWLGPAGIGDDVLSITAPIPKAMHLCLPTSLFSRLGDDYNLPETPTHSVRYSAVQDGMIHSIALSILSGMTTETSVGRLYAETASLMLAAHIIFTYADGRSGQPATSAHNFDQIPIWRVLDFISTHLADEITLEDMARVAGLSTFRFAHVFTKAVGLSPYRYISRLRLQNAMAEIVAGKSSLAQIAFQAGFSSQASFTRAFFRTTGFTPGQYRKLRR
jgi:AraC family transcriptional regulator